MAKRLSIDATANTALASIRRTIARWESGSSTIPDARYQWILAHVYAERGQEVQTGPGSDFLALLSAFQQMGVAPDRVAELHTTVLAWAEGRHPAASRLDDGDLAEMTRTLNGITQQIGKIPFVRSQIALAPLIDSLRHAKQTNTDLPPDGRTLAARTYAAAARLAFELRDDELSKRYYDKALSHAQRVPSQSLVASIGTSLAMVTMHRDDDFATAERIINTTIKAALAGPSMTTRARAFAIQSEIAARRKLVRPAAAALQLAEQYTEKASPDDPSGRPFDDARLAGFTGLYNLLTGSTTSAIDHLNRARYGIPESIDPIQLSIIVADLAKTHLVCSRPEPDLAVSSLRECVTLVGKSRSRVAAGRIRHVRWLLRRWNGHQSVADLDDHIYATLFD
ncbi:hypothetical protein RB614_09155 [Phytohabitans sp. ZYX-F-186]|uniref:Transcriptional regulator n=1 Tax=Phytohabitans maris TaxID=3071409 RepID=A0ABU0ZFF8_9ACTN|nr:hypothetical protein [Phytohabitans sp. ZYX-F-186]MDQ7904687.1 hypothetical protein [Phytohabitans sp. ZYX-F-186]